MDDLRNSLIRTTQMHDLLRKNNNPVEKIFMHKYSEKDFNYHYNSLISWKMEKIFENKEIMY